jgi:hypothetical protein
MTAGDDGWVDEVTLDDLRFLGAAIEVARQAVREGFQVWRGGRVGVA